MNRKVGIRMVIGLFAIAALYLGYWWFSNYSLDTDGNAKNNTVGMIAAIRNGESGPQAVLFKEDGTEVASNGFNAGNTDREISWSPDGNHIYFSSDRAGESYNIFRWNPGSNKVEQRSLETGRSQSAPTWGTPDHPSFTTDGLIVAGGAVFRYIPKLKRAEQILPPASKEAALDQEGGRQSAMAIYEKIGTSFKDARWGPGRQVIFAVMRRDEGEVFVINYMVTGPDGQPIPPIPVIAGDEIQMDVGPDGTAVIAVRNCQFPDPENVPDEYLKDGKPVVPYKHGLEMIRVESDLRPIRAPIVAFFDDNVIFVDPAISPAGDEIAVSVAGIQNGQDIMPKGLALVALKPTTQESPPIQTPILEGPITKPRWSGDGARYVFLKDEAGGKRSVYTADKDGSGESMISTSGDDFDIPSFSPQVPASS